MSLFQATALLGPFLAAVFLRLPGIGDLAVPYALLTLRVETGGGFDESRYQFFNRFALESVDNKASEFSSESEVIKVTGQVGAIRQFTDKYFSGATIDVSVSDGSAANDPDSRCNIAPSGGEDGYFIPDPDDELHQPASRCAIQVSIPFWQ